MRTLFAIALQLGRAFPQLITLVRAGFEGASAAARRASVAIAVAILRGARDRRRDRGPRTLHDQQQRTEPLTRPRPSRPGRSSQARVAAGIKARRAAAVKRSATTALTPVAA